MYFAPTFMGAYFGVTDFFPNYVKYISESVTCDHTKNNNVQKLFYVMSVLCIVGLQALCAGAGGQNKKHECCQDL